MQLTEHVRHNHLALTGLALFAAFVLGAVLAPLLAPHDPWAHFEPFLSPTVTHLLGTDDVGRDILSELITGARVSLAVGLLSGLLAVSLGVLMGLLAGFRRGRLDEVLMGLTDVVLVVPALPLVILVSVYLGPGVWHTILIIGLVEVLVHAFQQRRIGESRIEAEEEPRVRVQRLAFEADAPRKLHEPAVVHHCDTVGSVGNGRKVVRYQHERQPALLLESEQQRQYLRRDERVQARGRLVRDEHHRVQQQGASQGDPPPLAAGQLGRVALHERGRQVHLLQHVREAVAP